MARRIAINGYGRIGRNILRAFFEARSHHAHLQTVEIVAVNDVGNPELNAHLTRYDSLHGRFNGTVDYDDEFLIINGEAIRFCSERNPQNLPWRDLGVDLVFECTGLFTRRDQAEAHLRAGAEKVIVSAPAQNADATIVYGVNHRILSAEHQIISNASCTTNCLAPVAQVLHQLAGIERGSMTTIHAYTNDQALHDVHTGDRYRARAAGVSMIPTRTGAAAAVGLVLPELDGRLEGMAVRVPTANVSLVDLNVIVDSDVTAESINRAMATAANGELKGVLEYNEEPLVSVDFNHCPASAVFDATQARVNGRLVKVMAWYDNEWGFSNRMLDTALAFLAV